MGKMRNNGYIFLGYSYVIFPASVIVIDISSTFILFEACIMFPLYYYLFLKEFSYVYFFNIDIFIIVISGYVVRLVVLVIKEIGVIIHDRFAKDRYVYFLMNFAN